MHLKLIRRINNNFINHKMFEINFENEHLIWVKNISKNIQP
jgi:hypothetical protein